MTSEGAKQKGLSKAGAELNRPEYPCASSIGADADLFRLSLSTQIPSKEKIRDQSKLTRTNALHDVPIIDLDNMPDPNTQELSIIDRICKQHAALKDTNWLYRTSTTEVGSQTLSQRYPFFRENHTKQTNQSRSLFFDPNPVLTEDLDSQPLYRPEIRRYEYPGRRMI